MSLSKRYKKGLQITVRTPLGLRDLAKRTVALLGDELVDVPGTRERVKPSIAVLMLRGLATECVRIQTEAKKRRDALAECKRRGLKSVRGPGQKRTLT